MRYRAFGTALMLLLIQGCWAQETWAGLKFGMSLEDVRKSLGARITSEEVPEKNPADTIVHVKPIVIDGATGDPNVIIDNKSGKLIKVAINFGVKAAGRCFEAVSKEITAKQTLTVRAVGDKYLEKYGKPITESGSWPTDEDVLLHVLQKRYDQRFKCVRVWHSEGQIITTSLDMICDSLFLIVEYENKKLPAI